MKKIKITQLGWVFAGCFLGAGFVSGQELWQFFGSFGKLGTAGLILSMIILMMLGFIILRIAKLLDTAETDMIIGGDLSVKYPILGKIIGGFQIIFLIGIITVMIAGTGALVKQLLGISEFYGSLFMTVLIVLIAITGIDGVVSVFSVSVPIIAVSTLIFALLSIFIFDKSDINYSGDNAVLLPNWWAAAITYAAYNISTSFGILSPLGKFIESKKYALKGVLWGMILLILISGSILICIARCPDIVSKGLPMLEFASKISPVLGYIYGLLLLCGLLGTSVSSIVAISTYLSTKYEFIRKKRKISVTVIGAAAFGLSLAGFSDLVGTVYPVFGYISIVFIVCMLFNLARIKKII